MNVVLRSKLCFTTNFRGPEHKAIPGVGQLYEVRKPHLHDATLGKSHVCKRQFKHTVATLITA
jgi:hypothetical protein